MIDIRKLKELVRLMVENDLTELDLRDSEEQVTVRRPHPFAAPIIAAPQGQVIGAPHAPLATRTAGNGAAESGAAVGASMQVDDEDAGLVKIESPMVGTFYTAANPDSPPFVTIGAPVSPDKVVCIIEAMKIFNEIKAECSGTIHKVLVKNGQPVEFGQPLFLVKPG